MIIRVLYFTSSRIENLIFPFSSLIYVVCTLLISDFQRCQQIDHLKMPVSRSTSRDTTLYDLLEVSSDATQAQITKVNIQKPFFFHFLMFFEFFRLIK